MPKKIQKKEKADEPAEDEAYSFDSLTNLRINVFDLIMDHIVRKQLFHDLSCLDY